VFWRRYAWLAAGWLREAGVEEPVVNAVLAHAHEQCRTDLLSKAVVHADAIAGIQQVAPEIDLEGRIRWWL
jgi:predicted hydrolase (HD superfamily)